MDLPIWIAETDVVSLMDMRAAIAALETGLRAEARGSAQNMTKTHVAWAVPSPAGSEPHQATLHAIGAAFPEEGIVGTKTWAHTPGGATPLVILYDSHNGRLLAIIEAFAMGQLRTGAASALATRALAAAGADELALIGTGKQAVSQAAAIHAVRPLRRVRVFGRNPERRRRCADRLREDLGVTATESGTIEETVGGAPIITTVTRAREPFLTASMVDRGAHVNAVGAIVQTGAEIAPDLVARATRIVADSPAQARRLARELTNVLGDDDAVWAARVQRLADVIASNESRRPGDDVTLFKSLGMGISDLSLGIEVYRAALRAGAGRALATETLSH